VLIAALLVALVRDPNNLMLELIQH